MSPYDPFTSPLTAAESLSNKGRIGILQALFCQFGREGVLRLPYKTLARNLRLSAKTSVPLLDFLIHLENLMLLGEAVFNGEIVEVSATTYLLPVHLPDGWAHDDDFELSSDIPDDVGRARSDTKEAQRERQAKSRRNKRERSATDDKLERMLEALADQTPVTPAVTDEEDVTAFRAQIATMSRPTNSTGHGTASDQDRSDRINPEIQDFYKESNRIGYDPSKGIGETNDDEAVTPETNGRDISHEAVTNPALRAEIAKTLLRDPEGWTEVELKEALDRFEVQNNKKDIPRKVGYVRTILKQLRAGGFDQQRTPALHGAVPGGRANSEQNSATASALKIRDPDSSLNEFQPERISEENKRLLRAAAGSRTGTGG